VCIVPDWLLVDQMRKFPKKEKNQNTVAKPKPLFKPKKVLVDRPGRPRSKLSRYHRYEFLLNDEEQKVFQAIVDSWVKHYSWAKGSGRAETFRAFIERYNVETVKKERAQILEFGNILHARGEMIEVRDFKILELERKIESSALRIKEMSVLINESSEAYDEIVILKAELMELGKREKEQPVLDHAKEILEARKVASASVKKLGAANDDSLLAKKEEGTDLSPLCSFCGKSWTPPVGVDPVGFCESCLGERESLRSVMFERI